MDNTARRGSAIMAAAIVLLGGLYRLANLGMVRHIYDNAYPIYDALRILEGGWRPLLGQSSSVFMPNPPLMAYLQALCLLLWRSPWSVYMAVAGLNTVAIWLIYRTGRALLGEVVGLLAALLFAINPWVVLFSRNTWLPALLPFFTAFLAWGLWEPLASERPEGGWRVAASGLVLAVMLQTYITAWGILAPVGLLVVAFGRRLPRRALYLGAVVVLVAVLLYGIGVAEDWSASREGLLKFGREGTIGFNRDPIDHALRLVTGRDFDYVYTREQADDYGWRQGAGMVVHYVLALAILGGLVRAGLALRQPGRDRRLAVILLVWFLMPVLLMVVAGHRVHPQYLLLTCPAGHILAAWGLAALWRWPWSRWTGRVVLAFAALLFALNLHRAAQQVAARPTGAGFESWALRTGVEVGENLRDLLGPGPRPARVVGTGRDPLLSSLSGTYLTVIPNLSYPDYFLLPGRAPLVYVLPNPTAGPEMLGPHAETFSERDLALSDGTRVVFWRVQPYDREEALSLPVNRVDWGSEAGLALLGYSLTGSTQPGGVITCTTYWRVDTLSEERWGWYVGAFYHLLDAADTGVVNVSGHGQWGQWWEEGDIYVERVQLSVPERGEGPYQLEIGLFDTIHSRNYSLLSPEGAVYSLRVSLDPAG